jgi:hypothetical protein
MPAKQRLSKQRFSIPFTFFLLPFVCVLAPAAASAQDRVLGQFGAAVTWNQFPDNSGPGTQQTILDLGWTLSGARAFNRWLSVTAEVGISDNLMSSETTHRSEDNLVYTALAGPRATSRFFHRKGSSPYDIRLFGQMLAGAQISDLFPGGRAIQPGGGVDIKTNHRFSFRSQWDHTFVRGQHAISGSRWLTGIVIDFTE